MTITEHSSKITTKPVLCSDFVYKEKSRYERKGYGLLVASAIALTFFIGVPVLGHTYWADLLAWQDRHELSYTMLLLLVGSVLHNTIHLGANLVYWVFYHFEIPFIERYKSND